MFFIRFHDRVDLHQHGTLGFVVLGCRVSGCGVQALRLRLFGLEWSRIPFLMGSTSDKDQGSRTRTQSRASDKALQKL